MDHFNELFSKMKFQFSKNDQTDAVESPFRMWSFVAFVVGICGLVFALLHNYSFYDQRNKFRSRSAKVKKRELRISKKLLTEEEQPTKPYTSLLQNDLSTTDKGLTSQFAYILRNIQVFGHLENDLFVELQKHVKVVNLKAKAILFQPPDMDDSIYLVQKGKLVVHIKSDETQFPVKIVEEGDSVFSMLSVLELLTTNPAPLKTVSAKAEVPSIVLKLWAPALRGVFDMYPESWIRIVQNIALNLQHVTFNTLHSFLGLTEELLKRTIDKSVKVEETVMSANETINAHEKYVKLYTTKFAKFLGLENEESLLDNVVEVISYPNSFILVEQGSMDCSLYYIIHGSVEMLQETIGGEKTLPVSRASKDDVIGNMAILTGESSLYTFKTVRQTRLAAIKRVYLYELMKIRPKIVLNIARSLTQRISPFVRQIDFALSWLMCDAGRILYRQKDASDALYLVLSGRLQAVTTDDEEEEEIVEEFGRSDVVGMIELFTKQTRSSTVVSVRSTELVKLPEGLLNFVKHKYPQILSRLVTLMGAWVVRQHEHKLDGKMESLTRIANLNTIAVIAASSDVPLNCFTMELWHAMNTVKATLRLSVDVVERSLGRAALEKFNEYRLLSWLNQQEDAYDMVLYQCDSKLSDWTKRCIRQADCILIVAKGDNTATIGPIGKEFEKLAIRARKELVLLWPSNTKIPRNTAEWLNIKTWISSHYHIHAPDRLFVERTYEEMLRVYEKRFSQQADKFSDFSRLARILTGTSIGLVLGGGGARGASHIGVIRALKEAGIPIDFVGGTSIGAFIGALYCSNPNWEIVSKKARCWFKKMSSYWSKFFDLTYPYSSLFTGYNFNQEMKHVFGETQIEDLWIPYFNVTTDITSSEMRVHLSGSLWRYCRASMSLAGYLPPIPSEDDGHFLLDGGYINNLPADVMRNLRVATVFAIDVGGEDATDLTDFGDWLSGWWLLWKRWVPFIERVNVLSQYEIQSRLAYVSCARQLEKVKKAPYCYYIRPPIANYSSMDFGSFNEINLLGFECCKQMCGDWIKSGKLQELFSSHSTCRVRESRIRNVAYSFTDLAAIFSTTNRYNTNLEDSFSAHEDDHVVTPVQQLKEKVNQNTALIIEIQEPKLIHQDVEKESNLNNKETKGENFQSGELTNNETNTNFISKKQ